MADIGERLPCPYCDKDYANEDTLARHIESKHPNKVEEGEEEGNDEFDEFTPDLHYVPVWAKRYQLDAAELEQQLKERARKVWLKHKGRKQPVQCWAIARRRKVSEIRQQHQGIAGLKTFIGKVYANGDPFNWAATYYDRVKKQYDDDPQYAIENGLVRVERKKGKIVQVTILDPREKYSSGKDNPGYLKNAFKRDQYIMTIVGVCMPYSAYEKGDWDQVRPMFVTVGGDIADPESENFLSAPVDLVVKFRARDKTDHKKNSESYELEAKKSTQFVPVEVEIDGEMHQIDYLGDIEDDEGNIVRRVMHAEEIPLMFEAYYCELGDLEDYHESFCKINSKGTASNCNRLVVTEGTVINMAEATEEGKNHMIRIDDESLESGEIEYNDDGSVKVADSPTVWAAPQSTDMQFTLFSRILVFGNTRRTLKKDADDNLLDEWDTVSINANRVMVLYLADPEDIEEDAPADEDYESEGVTEVPEAESDEDLF